MLIKIANNHIQKLRPLEQLNVKDLSRKQVLSDIQNCINTKAKRPPISRFRIRLDACPSRLLTQLLQRTANRTLLLLKIP